MTAELPVRPDLQAVPTAAGLPGASHTIGKIAGALAKAQAEFGEVKKTKTAKVSGKTKDGKWFDYEYKYASLDDVLAAVLPGLSKHSIALLQPATRVQAGVSVETLLIHESGEWISSTPLVMPVSGTKAQEVGSAITYAKRYGISSLLGIAAEEDDDGSAASQSSPAYEPPKAAPAPKKITGKQMSSLVNLLVESGMTKTEAAKAASTITPDNYPEAVKRAEARIAEAKANDVPPCTDCNGKGADEATGEVCATCSGNGTAF